MPGKKGDKPLGEENPTKRTNDIAVQTGELSNSAMRPDDDEAGRLWSSTQQGGGGTTALVAERMGQTLDQH